MNLFGGHVEFIFTLILHNQVVFVYAGNNQRIDAQILTDAVIFVYYVLARLQITKVRDKSALVLFVPRTAPPLLPAEDLGVGKDDHAYTRQITTRLQLSGRHHDFAAAERAVQLGRKNGIYVFITEDFD